MAFSKSAKRSVSAPAWCNVSSSKTRALCARLPAVRLQPSGQVGLREGHDAVQFMEAMVTNPEITKVVVVSDKQYADHCD
jgi:hypothetical protein